VTELGTLAISIFFEFSKKKYSKNFPFLARARYEVVVFKFVDELDVLSIGYDNLKNIPGCFHP